MYLYCFGQYSACFRLDLSRFVWAIRSPGIPHHEPLLLFHVFLSFVYSLSKKKDSETLFFLPFTFLFSFSLFSCPCSFFLLKDSPSFFRWGRFVSCALCLVRLCSNWALNSVSEICLFKKPFQHHSLFVRLVIFFFSPPFRVLLFFSGISLLMSTSFQLV